MHHQRVRWAMLQPVVAHRWQWMRQPHAHLANERPRRVGTYSNAVNGSIRHARVGGCYLSRLGYGEVAVGPIDAGPYIGPIWSPRNRASRLAERLEVALHVRKRCACARLHAIRKTLHRAVLTAGRASKAAARPPPLAPLAARIKVAIAHASVEKAAHGSGAARWSGDSAGAWLLVVRIAKRHVLHLQAALKKREGGGESSKHKLLRVRAGRLAID
eukprot:scaffold60075_cov31-Tisochrysis_lutea.AAC.7